MSIDRIIFPHPKPTYTENYIKNKDDNSSIYFFNSPSVKTSDKENKVPALVMAYQQYEESFDMYVLFFHGNAEDLGTSMKFLKLLRESIRANIIAVEYPSYGIYNKKVSAEQIKVDALNVYDSLIEMGIDQSKIIIFGRSIGSGPACEIGAKRKPGGIVLLSAFTSIKKLSGEIAFSLVSYFIKERFNNIENVTHFQSPCLIIHGQADQLIKHDHSKQLQQALQEKGKTVLAVYPENMTHNQFQFKRDIIRPIENFLRMISFSFVKIKTQNLPNIFQQSIRNQSLESKSNEASSNDQNILKQDKPQIDKSIIQNQPTTIQKQQQQIQNCNNQKQIFTINQVSNDFKEEKNKELTKNNIQKLLDKSEIQQNDNNIQNIQVVREPCSNEENNTQQAIQFDTQQFKTFALVTHYQKDSQERKQFEAFRLNSEVINTEEENMNDCEMDDNINDIIQDIDEDDDDDDEQDNDDDYYYYHDGEEKKEESNGDKKQEEEEEENKDDIQKDIVIVS